MARKNVVEPLFAMMASDSRRPYSIGMEGV